ncbi:hypothetical protein ACWGDX_13520 [Streptomyces sp. NPDC055025]
MGLELIGGPMPERGTAEERRRAAVHVADRIASEHPHLTGRELAADPQARAGLLHLLDLLGLKPEPAPGGNRNA